MIWEIRYTKEADRGLGKLDDRIRADILEEISGLASDPRPHNSIRLRGTQSDYRLKIDRHRVLYRLRPTRDLILITRIEKRSGRTYRGYNPEDRA